MSTIRIDKVRIHGFRGIDNVEIALNNTTVLIGQHNSGKTSIIKALHLALGDYMKYLSKEDFHLDSSGNQAQEIIVDIRIIPTDQDGTRINTFSTGWQRILQDNIQVDSSGKTFFAFRNLVKGDKALGRYVLEKLELPEWKDSADWFLSSGLKRLTMKWDSFRLISVDAQRDISSEIKERSSIIGRFLANLTYDPGAVAEIENKLQEINDLAVSKSAELTLLKDHLSGLNTTFSGSGITDLTPVPKKIRDLSKGMSASFGETSGSSFLMEYHGMGTRSWASMLVVKSFIELLETKFTSETIEFFSILAAEEPEAHLHPNAQRTLYKQLDSTSGQKIISTHSPYVASMAKFSQIVHTIKKEGKVLTQILDPSMSDSDKKILERELFRTHGELIFANALVLFEGETEYQVLPLLFESYFGLPPFELGVNFISVNGSGEKYRPFLKLAHDFSIQFFIFSDGEKKAVSQLQKCYREVFNTSDDILHHPNIIFLEGSDFEDYLLENGFESTLKKAIEEVLGEGAIDTYIEKHEGEQGRRRRTDKICEKCNQYIYENEEKDYTGAEGRKAAIHAIIDSNKPGFGRKVAEILAQGSPDDFPPKIRQLFDTIEKELK